MSKKIAKVAATFAFSIAFVLPLSASAASLTQGQIDVVISLLQSFNVASSVVDNVKAALGGMGTAANTSACVALTHNMTLGSTGNDVSNLQNYLIGQGYLAAGLNTGYYGFYTAQAVGKFQIALGIVSSASDTAYGIFGPRTRATVTCSVIVTGTSSTSTATYTTRLSASPVSGVAPLTVSFTGTALVSAASYTLNYGDGMSDTLTATACTNASGCSLTASHTYAAAGTYTANLYAYPRCLSCGAVGTVTVTASAALRASFSAAPTSGTAPLDVSFSGTGLTPAASYTLEYGDGTNAVVQTSACMVASGCPLTATHTYSAAGTYTANLYTYPRCLSCKAVGTVTVTVSAAHTIPLSLTATPSSGAVPLAVSFSGAGVTDGSSYIIDYGDGVNSGALSTTNLCLNPYGCPKVNATHTYQATGTYTATLEPYVACMWAKPPCLGFTNVLATAMVTVQ